uniref:Uncharacterized protein n=1 Tax=Leersia perrieri TaxID=77586 RepID=A0A0D9XPC9_9ORYZ
MEFLISAVASDLISRFISYLTQNYSDHTCKQDDRRRLERILLRMHSVVEEAEGHHITNRGMLLQLKAFIEGFYLGHYMLDKIKFQPPEEESIDDEVVVIGRTEDIAKFGTTQPIRVKRLSEEEYWYYFKALAFGSMDPDEHPKLASLGLQVAEEMNGSFLGATVIGEILRANPNTQFWQSILLCLRELAHKHLSSCGLHPDILFESNIPVDFTRIAFVGAQVQAYMVYDLRVADRAQSELPNLTSREIILGNIPVEDKFDALVWRSRIPPYCDYIATFEKRKPRRMLVVSEEETAFAVGGFLDRGFSPEAAPIRGQVNKSEDFPYHLKRARHAAAMEAKFSQLAAAEFHQICCIKRKSANKIRGNAWRERSSSERGRDGWPERDRLVGFSSEAARFKVLYGDSPPCAPGLAHFANSNFDNLLPSKARVSMEILISAVADDLISQFISSVAQNYSNHTCKEDDCKRLERILLRMHSVVEEAEGLYITNQGMLRQLKGLTKDFYLRYYMLDKIKFQPPEEESIRDEVSHEIQSFALSTFNSAKRFPFADAIGKHRPIVFGRSRTNLKDVVDGLETKITDMREFVMFLGGYPRLPRQPYKDDQKIGEVSLNSKASPGKYLFVIEFILDVDEAAWTKFRSYLQNMTVTGIKVIVMSRTEDIAKFGTCQPIKMQRLSEEEYWYYFKALSFGSVDPDEHPNLASLGMQVANELNRSFIGATVIGDLISRFISSVAKNYSNHTCKDDDLRRLERILLRMHSIVEETDGRHITNQGMLLQLKGFIEGFYLGHYTLDKIKFQPTEEGCIEDEVSHEIHSFALSTCNSAKRFRFADAVRKHTPIAFGSRSTTNLKGFIEDLETMIKDMREFVMLLGSYPCLPRQPYGTYLNIDKCMFGRRIEKEQVINFLLCNDPHDPFVSILPIIGPRNIGKKTLVQHACLDERVSNFFSHIFFFKEYDLKIGELSVNTKASPGKYLFVIEFIWDVDEVAWTKFQSYLQNMDGIGIKVVILSRTEDIAKFGTCQPIRIKRLSEEEYWYYFKALAFGSMNPDEHPKLASLGLQVANEMNGSFIGATLIGEILRANPNTQFWKRMLFFLRELARKHLYSCGAHPEDLLERNIPIVTTIFCVGVQVQAYLVYDLRVAGHTQSELPNMTSQEILLGNIPVEDKFDVLVWKSRIPPYCAYIATHEKQKPRFKT